MKIWGCVLVVLVVFTVNVHGSNSSLKYDQINDQLGRVVKFKKDICRVVSLAPSITEIIFSIGAQNKLIGVTKYSDYPVEAKDFPTVGSYVYLDLEKIIALRPDLCFAIKEGNSSEIIDRLEFLGVPVYVVNPKNLTSVLSTVIEIGFLLDAEIRAKTLVNKLEKRIERVRKIVSESNYRPRVFFQLATYPIISAGKGTFIDDLITLSYGRNVISDLESYPHMSRENIIRLAPDIIVITSMGKEDVLTMEKIEWYNWPTLPAVSNGSIFVEMADLFDRPSPRLVDGLELLAMRIHPELFEELL